MSSEHPQNDDLQDFSIAHFAVADHLKPDISSQEWRLNTERKLGHSHCVFMPAGKGVITLTQGKVELAGPCFVWLPPGSVQTIFIDPGSEAFVMSFTENILSLAINQSQSSKKLRTAADTLVHIDGKKLKASISAILKQASSAIHAELREPQSCNIDYVSSYITIMLIWSQRLADFHYINQGEKWSTPLIFQRFVQAVELHFREQWGIAQYASSLGVTERRLHAAVVKSASKSPLELVHGRVLQEAIRRLEETSFSIAQIGYGLGFRHPAHFTRFFKQNVGLTPSSYRKEVRQKNIRNENYANWP